MGVEKPVEPLNHFEPITTVVEQANTVIDEVKAMEQINVPSDSTWKPYEDYRCITDKSSDQYKLLHGEEVVIDDDGLIYNAGYICTALGSKFGPVGSRYVFIIEGRDGTRRVVRIIKADQKQDKHTLNEAGWVGENGHIMEMIVDTDLLDENVSISGNCNNIPILEGRIVGILKIKEE